MKNLLITLCLLTWVSISAWAQTDYLQFEVASYTVKLGQRDMFEKGLAAHNKKFHNADPFKVGVFRVESGPGSGEYVLVMGPVTFSQIEGHPSGTEHDGDWQKNVLPYVESISESNYWRVDKDITYRPEGSATYNKSRLRFFTLNPGQSDRFKAAIQMIADVYKAKKYNATYTVYWKYGASQGPHVATEIGMNSWSWFDQPNTIQKDFEEVHGAGSWQKFMDELDIAIDRTKTFDQLDSFRPDLSSD